MNAGFKHEYVDVSFKDLNVPPDAKCTIFLALGNHNYAPEVASTAKPGFHDYILTSGDQAAFPNGGITSAGSRFISNAKVRGVNLPENVDLQIFSGIELERFLFNRATLCYPADFIGHGQDQSSPLFNATNMWSLSSDMYNSSVLIKKKLGIRTVREGPENVEYLFNEGGYKDANRKIKEVTAMLAWPQSQFDRQNAVNVVLQNELRQPFSSRMTYIFLLHNKGRYYTHHLYHNVKLFQLKVLYDHPRSLADELVSHLSLLSTPCSRAYTGLNFAIQSPEPLRPLSQPPNCSMVTPFTPVQVHRGYYNHFWTQVEAPTQVRAARASDTQGHLINCWQQKYAQDMYACDLMTARIDNFRRNEVHRMSMENVHSNRVCSFYSKPEECYLNGRTMASDARWFDPTVVITHALVQVDLPPEKRDSTKLIIYDFERYLGEPGCILRCANCAVAALPQARGWYYQTNEDRAKAIWESVNGSKQPDASTHFPLRPRNDRCNEEELKLSYVPDKLSKTFPLGVANPLFIYFINHVGLHPKMLISVINVPQHIRCFTISSDLLVKSLDTDPDCSDRAATWGMPITNYRDIAKQTNPQGQVWSYEPEKHRLTVGVIHHRASLISANTFRQEEYDTDERRVFYLCPEDTPFVLDSHDGMPSLGIDKSCAGKYGYNAYVFPFAENENKKGAPTDILRSICVPVYDAAYGYPAQGFYSDVTSWRVRRPDLDQKSELIRRQSQSSESSSLKYVGSSFEQPEENYGSSRDSERDECRNSTNADQCDLTEIESAKKEVEPNNLSIKE